MTDQFSKTTWYKNDYYKRVISNFVLITGYFCVVLALFLLYATSIKSTSFESNVLYNFDAEHYNEIKNNGYTNFSGLNGDERAFFPLFPLIWKYSHLSHIGISIFNFVLYCFSQSLLFATLNVTKKQLFVLTSFPSLMFMMLPYSESLFYLGSVMLIMGLIKKNQALLLFAFFFISMVRPAYTILLPAYILTTLLTERQTKTILIKSLSATIAVFIGVGIVALLQFSDSGEWLGFIKAQQGAPWFNTLKLPSLPYRSWAQFPPMPIDALAFTISVCCLLIVLKPLYDKLVNTRLSKVDATHLISMFYILGIGLAVYFFRGGSFHSLNRFVFCTVFIQLFLLFLWNSTHMLSNQYLYIVLCVFTIVWFFFNGFTHFRLILSYFGVSFYLVSLFRLHSSITWVRYATFFYLLLCHVVVHIFFLYGFFTWTWIA